MVQPMLADAPRSRALTASLALVAAALAVVLLRLEPPPPRGEEAPAEEFAAARALAALGDVLGDEAPHPTGSPANDAARERLVTRLRGLGLAPEVQAGLACGRRSAGCGRIENVVARLGGAGRPALLLSAHRDSVAAGPGAGDDGSGVAVLLELARIFAIAPPRGRDVIFLFVDGEEVGLLGAEAFVAEHPWAADVEVALNIDAGGNRGLATFTRASRGNAAAVAAIAGAVERPHGASLTTAVYALTPYDTDFSAYDRAEVLTLDLGIGEDKAPYHTPLDRLADLDPGSLQHLGDTALAAARALAGAELPAGAGERVYLDLLGLTMWTCPSGYVPWIGLGGLGLVLAALADLRRRRCLSLREVGAGLVGWPLLVGVPVGGAALLALVLGWIAGAEGAGQAMPVWPRVTLWAAVLAGSGALARRLGAWTGAWSCWAATWLWLGVATAIVAIVSPDASVALAPAVLAAMGAYGALALARGRVGPPPLGAVVAAGAVVPAILWLQAALRIEPIFGLGRHGAAASVVPVALVLSLVGPLWIAAPRRLARGVTGLSLGTCLVGVVGSLVTPPHSPSRPLRLNLVHDQEEGGAARWLVADAPGGLRAELRRAAEFAEEPARAFAWLAEDEESWIAPAGAIEAAAPELERVAEVRGAFGRIVRLRLRSPRGARSASLVLPNSAGVRALAIDGHTLPRYPERRREDYPEHEVYSMTALPAEGVAVDVMMRSTEPVTIDVIDAVDGLPASAEARALGRARPADAVPSHGGDRSLRRRQVVL